MIIGKTDKYKYLADEETLPSNRRKLIEQVYIFSFRRALKYQAEKQVNTLKSLNLSNKTDESKQNEDTFTVTKGLFNNSIIYKLQDIIKLLTYYQIK